MIVMLGHMLLFDIISMRICITAPCNRLESQNATFAVGPVGWQKPLNTMAKGGKGSSSVDGSSRNEAQSSTRR